MGKISVVVRPAKVKKMNKELRILLNATKAFK